jgi:hypothetical protein
MAKHKILGQVFTPNWIITEILDLVGYNNENIIDKYILEPSSGDGAFLLEIVKRYINSYLQNSSYSLFREYLKNEKNVKILIDFKEFSERMIFKTVAQ